MLPIAKIKCFWVSYRCVYIGEFTVDLRFVVGGVIGGGYGVHPQISKSRYFWVSYRCVYIGEFSVDLRFVPGGVIWGGYGVHPQMSKSRYFWVRYRCSFKGVLQVTFRWTWGGLLGWVRSTLYFGKGKVKSGVTVSMYDSENTEFLN